MPSIKRKVFGYFRQFSSATGGTSGSVLEETEDAALQQMSSEDEEPLQQSFILLYLNGQLRKRRQPEVYNAKTGVDLPLLLLDPLNPSLYAAYTGPEGGLTQVPSMRKKPVTNIASLDDELNLSFDTESFTEELQSDGRISPNNNYLHRSSSVSSELEMFQPATVTQSDSEGFQTFFNWAQPHERAFGFSTSLYECHPFTKVHAGEPIADVFGVCARENSCVLVLGDGVNWGEKSRLAARCGVRGVMDYLADHLYNVEKPIRTTVSFHAGHQLILQEGGTLTTLCAVVVCQLKDREEFVACAANVGDSLAFVYSQRYGVREITLASHDISQMRDMRDAGGALGPVDGVNPELHNFTCAMTVVEPGDIVFITSDGVSDNFDPVVGKFCVIKEVKTADKENIQLSGLPPGKNGESNYTPTSPPLSARRTPSKPLQTCQTETVAKDPDELIGFQLPMVEAHQRHELMLLRMEDLLQNGVTIGDPASQSAQDLCQNLVNFASQLTMAKRRILEDPELYPVGSKHKREDQKLRRRIVRAKIAEMPGKLDHASVVAYTVGVHEASRNATPNVDLMAVSYRSSSAAGNASINGEPISYDRSDTVPFAPAAEFDVESDPTHSSNDFPSVSIQDQPVINPSSYMNELILDVEKTPRPTRRFNGDVNISPVVEVYPNGAAYTATLVAALDRELWRDSSHNICELTLPLSNNLPSSGSVGGLSASSAQLSPDDIERLDSGLIGLSPGELLSDREEPPTPTDRILNGMTPDSDDNTVSLRPLPSVFNSKRNSRPTDEEEDDGSVKMIDDLSSASGSSLAGSIAALDTHSDLELSAAEVEENCGIADDLGENTDLLDGLTDRTENDIGNISEVVCSTDAAEGTMPTDNLLKVPVGRQPPATALESVSFDLSTIMEMSTSAEDMTMPSLSATKSAEMTEEISLDQRQELNVSEKTNSADLRRAKMVSGSVAALVEEILERCEDIIAPVGTEVRPSRLCSAGDSFKHSSLMELSDMHRGDSQRDFSILATTSTADGLEEETTLVKLRLKPEFPCDSLVDLKTKSNSYYGATLDNPIGSPESELIPLKDSTFKSRSSRGADKKPPTRPLDKLEKFVHRNDGKQKTRVDAVRTTSTELRESSKERKKHGRHSPQRHTVAVEMGFMQKIRSSGTGFMSSLKHPRTSVSSDASSSGGDSDRMSKAASLTTSPLKSPRTGSGFGWSPTKSIQKTWKALSARETLAETEEKSLAKRSLSTSKAESAGPSSSSGSAKLPPVSPRNSSGRSSAPRESVSNRFASAFGRKYNVAAAEGGQSGTAAAASATAPAALFHRQKSFDFSLLLKRKSGGKNPPSTTGRTAVVSTNPDPTATEDPRNLLIRQKTDIGTYSSYRSSAEVTPKTPAVSSSKSAPKPRVESTV